MTSWTCLVAEGRPRFLARTQETSQPFRQRETETLMAHEMQFAIARPAYERSDRDGGSHGNPKRPRHDLERPSVTKQVNEAIAWL